MRRSSPSTPIGEPTTISCRRVLDCLDAGRPVAFYGWWPTAELATTTEILGVDAMEVPPPDRKRTGLADGHAVVIVGYGRHDAFPGAAI